MAGNTFGEIFKITTFGESHGSAIGGIIDGCPAGLELSEAEIQKELDLRKPGSGLASSARKESDTIKILSGVFENKTTGTPIGLLIKNEDQHSRDYSAISEIFRPGHADWTYYSKYNHIRDYRGGGRASARETAVRVAAGSIAKKLLNKICHAKVCAAAIELGGIGIPEDEIEMEQAVTRPFFAASENIVTEWNTLVTETKKTGDTLGGLVRIVATGIPAGLGEPVFDKLDARLAFALMSVGAVKGVEIGAGFQSARLKGSKNNDAFYPGVNGQPHFETNNAGGILGGISTGQDIIINVAVKPIASLGMEQMTIDKKNDAQKINIGGRHDLSAIPRIVPVLSAMSALVLIDALFLQKRMETLW